VAIITGSTTSWAGETRRSAATMASTMSDRATMPTLTALTSRSANTASSCAVTNSAGTTWTPVTPRVFWAVSAVITDAP